MLSAPTSRSAEAQEERIFVVGVSIHVTPTQRSTSHSHSCARQHTRVERAAHTPEHKTQLGLLGWIALSACLALEGGKIMKVSAAATPSTSTCTAPVSTQNLIGANPSCSSSSHSLDGNGERATRIRVTDAEVKMESRLNDLRAAQDRRTQRRGSGERSRNTPASTRTSVTEEHPSAALNGAALPSSSALFNVLHAGDDDEESKQNSATFLGHLTAQ